MIQFFEVDKYLSKRFSLKSYNCWHFALDVWEDITGERLYDFTPAELNKGELQLAAQDATHRFVRVPENHHRQPLFALATTPRDSPHIGVLFNGRVLHLRKEGAIYQRLEAFMVGFNDVHFYTTASQSP